MADLLTKRMEAEREWFRKEHEKQFGEPTQSESDRDKELKKVLADLERLSRKRVAERKHFNPTIQLPPLLVEINWDAPLALKCACPSGDCNCSCKGNTLLPKKRLPIIPRNDWWGLRPVLCWFHIVKCSKPAGDLAKSFAESIKKEAEFYRSPQGRAILEERGPEFCLSGCLKFFITNKKIQKDYTEIIKQMKPTEVPETVEGPIEKIRKKPSWDRICDQFRCTVSTQSTVGEDGEFIIGEYSHLLFGSPDENYLCDIEGAELHVASYKAEEDVKTGMFVKVVKTADKLFHVSDIKQRISQVKKDFITSVFEIKEKRLSKASQYECKDLPVKVPRGVCESLADVRRKLKEKQCREKKHQNCLCDDIGDHLIEEQKSNVTSTESADTNSLQGKGSMIETQESMESKLDPYEDICISCSPSERCIRIKNEMGTTKSGISEKLRAEILRPIECISDDEKTKHGISFLEPSQAIDSENNVEKNAAENSISSEILDDERSVTQTLEYKDEPGVETECEQRKKCLQEIKSNITKSVEMVILQPDVIGLRVNNDDYESSNKYNSTKMQANIFPVQKSNEIQKSSEGLAKIPNTKDSVCQPCDKIMEIGKYLNEALSCGSKCCQGTGHKHVKDEAEGEKYLEKSAPIPKNPDPDAETSRISSKGQRKSEGDVEKMAPDSNNKLRVKSNQTNTEFVSPEWVKVTDEGRSKNSEDSATKTVTLSKHTDADSETIDIKKASDTDTKSKIDSQIQKSSNIDDSPSELEQESSKVNRIKPISDIVTNEPVRIKKAVSESPELIQVKEASKFTELKKGPESGKSNIDQGSIKKTNIVDPPGITKRSLDIEKDVSIQNSKTMTEATSDLADIKKKSEINEVKIMTQSKKSSVDTEIQKASIKSTPVSELKKEASNVSYMKISDTINVPDHINKSNTDASSKVNTSVSDFKEILSKTTKTISDIEKDVSEQTKKTVSEKSRDLVKGKNSSKASKNNESTESNIDDKIKKSNGEDMPRESSKLEKQISNIVEIKKAADVDTKSSDTKVTFQSDATTSSRLTTTKTEESRIALTSKASDTIMKVDSRVRKSSVPAVKKEVSKVNLFKSLNEVNGVSQLKKISKEPTSDVTEVSKTIEIKGVSDSKTVVPQFQKPNVDISKQKGSKIDQKQSNEDVKLTSKLKETSVETRSGPKKIKTEFTKADQDITNRSKNTEIGSSIWNSSTNDSLLSNETQKDSNIGDVKNSSKSKTKETSKASQLSNSSSSSSLSSSNITKDKKESSGVDKPLGESADSGLRGKMFGKVNRASATDTKVDKHNRKPGTTDVSSKSKSEIAGSRKRVKKGVKNKEMLDKKSSAMSSISSSSSSSSVESSVGGDTTTKRRDLEETSSMDSSKRDSPRIRNPCPVKQLLEMSDSFKSLIQDELPNVCKNSSCKPCNKLKDLEQAVSKAFSDIVNDENAPGKYINEGTNASTFLNKNLIGTASIEIPKTPSDGTRLKREDPVSNQKVEIRKTADEILSQLTIDGNIEKVIGLKRTPATEFSKPPISDRSKLKETNKLLDKYINETPLATEEVSAANVTHLTTSKKTDGDEKLVKKKARFQRYKKYLPKLSLMKNPFHMKNVIKNNFVPIGPKKFKEAIRRISLKFGRLKKKDSSICKSADAQNASVFKLNLADVNIKSSDKDVKSRDIHPCHDKPIQSKQKQSSEFDNACKTFKTIDDLGKDDVAMQKVENTSELKKCSKQAIRKLSIKLSQLSWKPLARNSLNWQKGLIKKILNKYFNNANTKSINSGSKCGGIKIVDDSKSTGEDCGKKLKNVYSEAPTKSSDKYYRFYY